MSIIRGYSIYDGLPKELEISNGRIKRITTKRRMESDTYSDQYIAPGLIDNQINGYLGVDFTGPGLTVDKVREVTRALWKVGVTTYFPTLITSSYENLLENFSILAAAVRDSEIGQSIPGFHLEGPYISPEDGYRGAHPREWVRAPDWKEFEQLYAAGDRKISQVTLAPEQPGSLDFIRVARSSGIVIALGHHNASPQIIRDAVEAGAAISTHLGNGCANMIHRHDNPLWTQLAEDRLMASIIVDGIHLRPEEVQTFYKVKGTDGILLTSDVTHLAGLQPGSYSINGRDVVLTSDGMIK
ncbi:MAG TPA: N-acetylglucosamine-6-phosphate deacetylase, partial [bacterium]|nr:N-acetylglucosamine-6-phosphate deacetylase [bacterium]